MSSIIIGAGIAGLSTAIALQQRGISAQVYESSALLAEAGAGIFLPPNAMNILARYGSVQ